MFCCVSTEEAAPPLPSCSVTHYENGSSSDIMGSPPPLEKPKRNGTRLEEARPTVESLLTELEGPVPSPRCCIHVFSSIQHSLWKAVHLKTNLEGCATLEIRASQNIAI